MNTSNLVDSQQVVKRTVSAPKPRMKWRFWLRDEFLDIGWDGRFRSTTTAQITKRTKRLIFAVGGTWAHHCPYEVEGVVIATHFTLDRAKLERGEEVKGWTLNPHPPITIGAVPDWAAVLELTWPATMSDVRKAWRNIAKKLHPDAGGDPAAFMKAKRAYETASQVLGGT